MKSGEDWNARTAEEAERTIGYTFRNKELLKRCFTHSSYGNVSRDRDNERLEFLGDAVLGLCISEKLFLNEGNKDEGALTDIRKEFVSQGPLTVSEKKLNLMRFLRYSGGSGNVGGKTPSSLFEAVVAGIYLDGGLEEARRFIEKNAVRVANKDYVSDLQVLVQDREHCPPKYTFAEEEGLIVCTASALGESATERDAKKSEAKKAAAKSLYKLLVREES